MKTFVKSVKSTLWTIFCLIMAGVGAYSMIGWISDIKEHWSWLDDDVEIDLDEDGDT